MKKKFMNFLETLSRDEMRIVTGGYDDYNSYPWVKVYEQNDGQWGYYFVNSETGEVRDLLGNVVC